MFIARRGNACHFEEVSEAIKIARAARQLKFHDRVS